MKKLLQALAIIVLFGALFFLMFAMMNESLRPLNWKEWQQITFVALTSFFSLLAMMVSFPAPGSSN